ncbi:MAG: hypothetical protein V1787_03115 [Candidatus Micrarchaeota archaeon]
MAMIEDELTHWFKDDNGGSHKSSLRLETEQPVLSKGYPKDGIITVRILNGVGTIGFKLSPDEALRVGTHLLQLSKEHLQRKRKLWNEKDETYQRDRREDEGLARTQAQKAAAEKQKG